MYVDTVQEFALTAFFLVVFNVLLLSVSFRYYQVSCTVSKGQVEFLAHLTMIFLTHLTMI